MSLTDEGCPQKTTVPGAVIEVQDNNLQISMLKSKIVEKLCELQELPGVTNVPYKFQGHRGKLHVYHQRQWLEVQLDDAFKSYLPATKKVCTDIKKSYSHCILNYFI